MKKLVFDYVQLLFGYIQRLIAAEICGRIKPNYSK